MPYPEHLRNIRIRILGISTSISGGALSRDYPDPDPTIEKKPDRDPNLDKKPDPDLTLEERHYFI